jgi:hypothetical protein
MRLLGDRVSRQVASQIAMEHDWDTLRDAGYLAGSKLQADAPGHPRQRPRDKADGVVPLAPLEALT